MNETVSSINRPPIGFIVEGYGEHNCYPSLVCRIVDSHGFRVPRVNAGGYGNIVRHLGDQLKPLVLAYHPYHVIITLDLKDVLNEGLCSSCAELRLSVEEQARNWLANCQAESRLHPLPERIIAVVQVQAFESWMIADIQGLREGGYLAEDEPQPPNVDEEVPNPTAWLRERMWPGRYQKNPRCAKAIVTCLDPGIMRANSHSFDKLYREVVSSYTCWCNVCGIS